MEELKFRQLPYGFKIVAYLFLGLAVVSLVIYFFIKNSWQVEELIQFRGVMKLMYGIGFLLLVITKEKNDDERITKFKINLLANSFVGLLYGYVLIILMTTFGVGSDLIDINWVVIMVTIIYGIQFYSKYFGEKIK